MTRSAATEHAGAAASGFAAVMRDRTKLVHREAERTGFVAELIRGRATRDGYALFLRNLVPAYAAMEHALEAHRGKPILGAFADPRLARLPALESDIAAIAGPAWASTLPLVNEAQAYAAAIEEAARGEGLRLVAHAYARYLGDLSGGQILKPLLGRAFGLGPDMLAFYDFPEFPDLHAPKLAMRDALDAIPAAGPEAEPIVAEALTAFRHNIALSEAVQAALS
jgi:heme oxygenase